MSDEESDPIKRPKALYLYHASNSFATESVFQFLSYFATRLGASFVQLAWMSALLNLLPNALQHFWGFVSDNSKLFKRSTWILGASVLASISFFMISQVTSPDELILLVILYSIALSIITPTWSALQGDWIAPAKRGTVLSNFHIIGGIFGLVGMLVAAYLIYIDNTNSADAFRKPFILSGIVTLIAGLFLIRVPYRDPNKIPDLAITEETKHTYSDSFHAFTKAQMIYVFFMSFIWPLWAVLMIKKVGATNLELIGLSVAGAVSEMCFQPLVGRLVDRVGPLPVLTLSRMMFVFLPATMVLFPRVEVILLLQIFIFGPAFAGFLVTTSAHILDLSPNNERAAYFSYFNARVGICTFAGTLVGGYLAHSIEWYTGDYWQAIFTVYMLSTLGRLFGTTYFMRLKSPRPYPSSIRILDRMQTMRPPWQR